MTDKDVIRYVKENIEKSVFIYGAGKYGRIAHVYLIENGFEVRSFIVTNIEQNGSFVLDIPVTKMTDTTLCSGDSIVLVAVSEKYQEEIVQNLISRGVENYLILDDECIRLMDESNEYSIIPEHDLPKVLLYHRVMAATNDIWNLCVSPNVFEKQMLYLKDNYNIVRFEDVDLKRGGRQVAITFDDGYVDNYKMALPILEKLKIPATIFVASGNVDIDDEFWWDELERMIMNNPNCPEEICVVKKHFYLQTQEEKKKACYTIRKLILGMDFNERNNFLEDLKEITKDNRKPRIDNRTIRTEELRKIGESQYISIGGHTVTHTRMTSLTRERKSWEIKESKKTLERILGHNVNEFSFPFGNDGDYDYETIKLAISAGYKRIAAVQSCYPEAIEYNIPRIGIHHNDKEAYEERTFRRQLILG